VSLFEKYAVDPRSRHASRWKLTFMDNKIARSGTDGEAGACPNCGNGLAYDRTEDMELCVNRRCDRSGPEGWVGSGWASHPNAKEDAGW
jgi:hypothetical protein